MAAEGHNNLDSKKLKKTEGGHINNKKEKRKKAAALGVKEDDLVQKKDATDNKFEDGPTPASNNLKDHWPKIIYCNFITTYSD